MFTKGIKLENFTNKKKISKIKLSLKDTLRENNEIIKSLQPNTSHPKFIVIMPDPIILMSFRFWDGYGSRMVELPSAREAAAAPRGQARYYPAQRALSPAPPTWHLRVSAPTALREALAAPALRCPRHALPGRSRLRREPLPARHATEAGTSQTRSRRHA